MLIILFRSQLTRAAGADYDAMHTELESLVKGNPGFIRAKDYTAPDGEHLTLTWWRDEESLREWRELARHREAQSSGRKLWFAFYEIEVANITRTRRFERPQGDDSAAEPITSSGVFAPRVLEELSTFPARVWTAAQGLSASGLQRPPVGGGFSMVEHVCHLRDYEEAGCLGRIQRILAEAHPHLAEFEGEKLARERTYSSQSFSVAVDDFARHRQRTLGVLLTISGEQAERTATLGTMGVISIRRLVEIVREHDRTHRQEIERLLGEMRAQA